MTTSGDDRFDAQARAVHQRALQSLSPRTLAQLQLRRRAARSVTGRRVPAAAWSLAAACAVGVLAVGLQWGQPDLRSAPSGAGMPRPMETTADADAPPAATGTAAAIAQPDEDTGVLALSESPEMYAWLESSEAVTLAME